MNSIIYRFCLFLLCFLFLGNAEEVKAQIGVHTTIDEILAGAFQNTQPQYKTLWLQQSVKERFNHDLGFSVNGLRIRYWQENDRTLWILDEIGKEYPITFAYIIDSALQSTNNSYSPETLNGEIHSVTVMEYRESRGGEIRHDFFRTQFEGIQLKGDRLDQKIDGITGATLSVLAMEKTAKMALWLHQEALKKPPQAKL